MILWIILAIMTVIAVLAVLIPLARHRAENEAEDASDVAVYKDQLNEVKQDFDRGLIAETKQILPGRRLHAACLKLLTAVMPGARQATLRRVSQER